MKRLLLSVVLLFAVSSFADTVINNFTGYNDGWTPFGDPGNATQTYGEVFTAPDETNLASFSFYMGNPVYSGGIVTGAYVAKWNGDRLGQLLYSSPEIDYDNLGNEEVTVNTGGLTVTPGTQYIVFLSTSLYHGQSSGATSVPFGSSDPNLNGFAYFNNGGGFENLFSSKWDGFGASPDWAVNLQFDSTPEPSSLILLGTGILGSFGMLRRK